MLALVPPEALAASQPARAKMTYEQGYNLAAFRAVGALWGLLDKLRAGASIIRAIPANQALVKEVGYKTLLEHSRSLHRLFMASAIDVALRLVAAVWDLGVRERDISPAIILKNQRCTSEVKRALKALDQISDRHRFERNRIAHEGGSPNLEEAEMLPLFEFVLRSGNAEAIPENVYHDGFADVASTIARQIDEDVAELEKAAQQLLSALEPEYANELVVAKLKRAVFSFEPKKKS